MKHFLFATALLSLPFHAYATAHEDYGAAAAPGPGELLRAPLASAEGAEVILSEVLLAPDQELAWHYHPGEEFAYVIDGSLTLQQEGIEPEILNARDSAEIASEVIHRAKAGPDGARIIVFRVHAAGQPERILVDR